MQSEAFHIVEVVSSAFAAAGTMAVPVIIYIWSNKRSAKADADERAAKTQSLIQGLAMDEKYYSLHKHGEKHGPLIAEGIEYPPNGNKE